MSTQWTFSVCIEMINKLIVTRKRKNIFCKNLTFPFDKLRKHGFFSIPVSALACVWLKMDSSMGIKFPDMQDD